VDAKTLATVTGLADYEFMVADNGTRAGAAVVERDATPTIETATTSVVVETTARTPVADAVAPGDEQRVGEDAVLTVTAVETTRVNETHADLRAALALETRTVDGVPR